MLVQDEPGKMLVSFCPGDALGLYSDGEETIKNIACTLGDFCDRVFDMYFEFSSLADQGLLVRKEYGELKGAITVSFCYKKGSNLKMQRQIIINELLNNYLHSSVYPRAGIYVVRDSNDNCKLISSKKNVTIYGLTPISQRY